MQLGTNEHCVRPYRHNCHPRHRSQCRRSCRRPYYHSQCRKHGSCYRLQRDRVQLNQTEQACPDTDAPTHGRTRGRSQYTSNKTGKGRTQPEIKKTSPQIVTCARGSRIASEGVGRTRARYATKGCDHTRRFYVLKGALKRTTTRTPLGF